MSEFKNETLFAPRISEAEARETVAHAIKMGWAHLPVPPVVEPKPPFAKKRLATRSDPVGMSRIEVDSLLPSDVPPPA